MIICKKLEDKTFCKGYCNKYKMRCPNKPKGCEEYNAQLRREGGQVRCYS